MPDAKDYKIIELETENDNLKDEIIEMQKLEILQLRAQLAKFINTGVESGYVKTTDPNVKHKVLLKTTSELARFLEMKSIKKAEHVKKIDNPS